MGQPKIAVIGAGIAGVSLARSLADRADVTIFEKSRGLGGRMATRRRPDGHFDHGAQYFTIRDPRFHAALEEALERGVIETWDADLMQTEADGTVQSLDDRSPRFVGVPGMTAPVRAQADGLAVLCSMPVQSVEGEAGAWYLMTETGPFGPFDWIVSSAPAPQTTKLLPFAPSVRQALARVDMNGCFTLMIRLPDEAALPFAASRIRHPVLSWIAANNSKPDRNPAPALVVHADNGWSDRHLDAPPEAVRDLMLEACQSLYPMIGWQDALSIDLHRWRYANVARPLGQPFLLDSERQIAACGDWCLGNRVEAAFLSGTALADTLHTHLAEARA
ncbi:NAD(P)/FAD-dependent oxidoreductase [Allorhizobium pseudoryzae]|uniref:NAD(P)/FAD-dependent oxidoreductase n=1 Tax=Allorhizobium pseudoryzae TaxID=379684 RepID=UPI003D065AA2